MRSNKSRSSSGVQPVAVSNLARQHGSTGNPQAAGSVPPPSSGLAGASAAASLQILTEDVLTLNQAARELPTRTHLSTVYRWAKRGVNGRKLETLKVGSQFITSRQALTRFLLALND